MIPALSVRQHHAPCRTSSQSVIEAFSLAPKSKLPPPCLVRQELSHGFSLQRRRGCHVPNPKCCVHRVITDDFISTVPAGRAVVRGRPWHQTGVPGVRGMFQNPDDNAVASRESRLHGTRSLRMSGFQSRCRFRSNWSGPSQGLSYPNAAGETVTHNLDFKEMTGNGQLCQFQEMFDSGEYGGTIGHRREPVPTRAGKGTGLQEASKIPAFVSS